jgi:glutathione S-transferase
MMKIYGHPWSINTRKVLMTFAEKGHSAELVLVMVPKGEHKSPQHVALHPFGKVPVLEDSGFVLYETGAINRYVAKKLAGPSLLGRDEREGALIDQWISVADSYFAPHAQPLLVETLFRRYLGGDTKLQLVSAARPAILPALDVLDRGLREHPHLAGETFSIADIHWMPYLDYLVATNQAEAFETRPHLAAWWKRVSTRASWQKVAHQGPQPYELGMTAEVIEKQYR